MHKKKYRACLVTGASSGLGREIALQLSQKTNLLILLGKNNAELQRTAEECKNNSADSSFEVLALPGDLCNLIYFQTVLDLFKTYPLDLLINNAGAGLYGNTLEYPLFHHQHLFQLNGWVPLHLTYHALQHWQKEEKPGTILQVGSALAFIPSPYSATYAAAKSFLVEWTLALSEELQGQPQKVLVFCPGMIKTPFRKRASLDRDFYLEGLEISTAAAVLLKQLETGELLKIIPLRDRILLFLSHCLPLKWVLRLISKKLQVRT